MAIAFLRVEFVKLRPDSGACKLFSYLSRGTVRDRRLGKTFDFRRLDRDLVHAEIICPVPLPDGLANSEDLANAIDLAEFGKVRRDLGRRQRLPQIGASLVLALPPDEEAFLDEAIEMVHRTIRAIVGDLAIPALICLHDPARITPGAQNRHAHIHIGLREIEKGRLATIKTRGLFARPRCATGREGKIFVAEGIDAPALSWEIQQVLFNEIGVDQVVDPPAPYAEPQWTRKAYRNDPRVADHAWRTRERNRETILGDPARLVELVLRGRSSIQTAELNRLLDRFIDAEENRERQLERILDDPGIVGLAEPSGREPRLVTTKAIHALMRDAARLIDRAAVETEPAIMAITAADHARVAGKIGRLLGDMAPEVPPILLGQCHSDLEQTREVLASVRPTCATIKSFIEAVADPAGGEPVDRARQMVIVPKAESLDDQTLARAIVAADRRQLRLVLGHDQGRETGIACRRLAAYAAERLAIGADPDPGVDLPPDAIERHLRAGLIATAVRALASECDLIFEPLDEAHVDRSAGDFIVSDDPKRVVAWNARQLRLERADASPGREDMTDAPGFRKGDAVVCTRTDYGELPPRIRAGLVGRIVSIDPKGAAVELQRPDGEATTVVGDPSGIRLARCLTIREARRIQPPARLVLEVGSSRHVWASLLLAARYGATLIVDPAVARDLDGLVAAARTSIAGALPHELSEPRSAPDVAIHPPEAEVPTPANPAIKIETVPEFVADFVRRRAIKALAEPTGTRKQPAPATRTPSAVPGRRDKIAAPEPQGPARRNAGRRMAAAAPAERRNGRAAGIPIGLHEKLRAILARPECRLGLQRLQAALRQEGDDGDLAAERLFELCRVDGPTAILIHAMRPRPKADTETDAMAELDLPATLAVNAPRAWTPWDLYQFRMDLLTMSSRFADWQSAFPPEPEIPDRSMRP